MMLKETIYELQKILPENYLPYYVSQFSTRKHIFVKKNIKIKESNYYFPILELVTDRINVPKSYIFFFFIRFATLVNFQARVIVYIGVIT